MLGIKMLNTLIAFPAFEKKLDRAMCCVLFHQMRDAGSELCFPADKQDGIGIPVQEGSARVQLKSF